MPSHWGVLVMAFTHGPVNGLMQSFIHLEIRETLSKVDCTVFDGQSTHDGEDVGADVGKFAVDRSHTTKFFNFVGPL
jgi:hypothetical protein